MWQWHCMGTGPVRSLSAAGSGRGTAVRLHAAHVATGPAGHGAGEDGGNALHGREGGEKVSRQMQVRTGGWR